MVSKEDNPQYLVGAFDFFMNQGFRELKEANQIYFYSLYLCNIHSSSIISTPSSGIFKYS